MRTPRMDQESSQSTPLIGLQPNSQDRSHTRRMQSNSTREQGVDKEGQRSRASSFAQSDMSSETSRYNKARAPINEAVHSALDPIDPNHTAISPEVLDQITSQITASVLQRLKETQLSPTTASAASNGVDHMDSISSTDNTPPIDRDKVYTPPSPYRASEEAAQTTSPTSPRKQTKFPPISEPRRPPSPPFSHGTLSDVDAREGATRTSTAEQTATEGDATVLEKIWGELFDTQGRPTKRLSQFLRGIAVHIIEDYEPKHSLVITPEKMQKYYEETKLGSEIYPWQVIFDDRTSSISRMLRDVEAQHHLIQERLSERPDIPGLTPIGFETWMLLILRAHPEEEFERLAHTALNMPVSNPDDRKERFPKELSRRQFPKDPEHTVASRLQKVMFTHCGVKIPSRNSSSSDKENKPTQSSTALPEENIQPSTGANLSKTTTRSSVSEVDSHNLRPIVSESANETSPIEVVPPPQIERERKPYVAQPGGGKSYDNFNAPIVQPAESKAAHPIPPTPAKLTRSASLNNGRTPRASMRPVQPPVSVHQKAAQGPPPAEVSQPTRTRTGSVYHRDAPTRLSRNRSPSISRDKAIPPHKSDGESTYGSYYPPPPHKSDGEIGYGPYYPTTSSDTAAGTWRPDNRYDHRASFPSVVDNRDLNREPRQRYHSVSSSDGYRYYPKDYPSDEEYYRSGNAGYPRPDASYSSSQQCPPTSYRNRA